MPVITKTVETQKEIPYKEVGDFVIVDMPGWRCRAVVLKDDFDDSSYDAVEESVEENHLTYYDPDHGWADIEQVADRVEQGDTDNLCYNSQFEVGMHYNLNGALVINWVSIDESHQYSSYSIEDHNHWKNIVNRVNDLDADVHALYAQIWFDADSNTETVSEFAINFKFIPTDGQKAKLIELTTKAYDRYLNDLKINDPEEYRKNITFQKHNQEEFIYYSIQRIIYKYIITGVWGDDDRF